MRGIAFAQKICSSFVIEPLNEIVRLVIHGFSKDAVEIPAVSKLLAFSFHESLLVECVFTGARECLIAVHFNIIRVTSIKFC